MVVVSSTKTRQRTPEGLDDLRDFDVDNFLDSLLDVDAQNVDALKQRFASLSAERDAARNAAPAPQIRVPAAAAATATAARPKSSTKKKKAKKKR